MSRSYQKKKKKKQIMGLQYFFPRIIGFMPQSKLQIQIKKKHKAGNRKIFKENIILNKRIQ
jgi:hypothetical protein